jgi:hypothetical protein
MAKVVVGRFSDANEEAAKRVRRMYDASGNYLGTITKRPEGGYRVHRVSDGKQRIKSTLEEAKKSIARLN